VTTEQTHPFRLFERLNWLTGAPLISVIEPYRRRIFEELLYSFDDEGSRKYTFGLLGRAKKNWKSADRDCARKCEPGNPISARRSLRISSSRSNSLR
jgi:hypothetical protein